MSQFSHRSSASIQRARSRTTRLLWALLMSISLATLWTPQEAEAHAWAKQKPVLFLSAEVSDTLLKLTICLPAPLLNQVLNQPIDPNYTLKPEQQEALSSELERYFQTHNPILVDGLRALPNLSALDLVLSAPLTEVEAAPLSEGVKLHSGNEGAAIMTFEVGLKTPPKLISLTWDSEHLWVKMGKLRPGQLSSKVMPGVFVYQDELTPIKLTPEDPEQLWRPLGPKLKAPPPSALTLTPPPPPESLKDHPALLALWAVLLILGIGALKADRRALGLTLTLLCGASPVTLWLSPNAPKLWAVEGDQLTDEELRAIFELLHQNIYRAFDYERDEEIYDALSQSVTGPLLDWTFQEMFRSLILQDEGGAKAKVSVVKPLSWELTSLNERERRALSSGDSGEPERIIQKTGAFAAQYRWRVIGEVTHWGHSHRRVNDYEARYAVAHGPEGWRIFSARSRGSARRPELEGGL